jgi:hypothetical protein
MRLPEESRAPAFKGRSDGKRSASATAFGDYFPPAQKRLCIAKQNSRRPPSSAYASAQEGAEAARPPSRGSPRKAAMGAATITGSLTMTIHTTDFEPPHASSPTDRVLTELKLYGYRPSGDEPDLRPLPEPDAVGGAVADIFDALVATLADTRLEPDLEDLLWSTVNLFHRAADRLQRELDRNEDAQKRSQAEQDGSEIRSVELERLLAQGQTLIERRDSMERFRDHAADGFERHTGSAWRPRAGSLVSHRTLTAAMIDSRDFLAAKRRAETQPLLPPGPKVAFTGGLDFNDHRAIWDRLDKVFAKHPDMVLLHGGSPKGAERIAACWADNRKVPQIAFKPDWTRHAKAAPFRRNDRMLEVLPIGVIAFPGSGISANLADKAKKLGIPVWTFGSSGA